MTGLKFYIIELYLSGCIRFHSDTKASKKNGGTLHYVVITKQRKDQHSECGFFKIYNFLDFKL